jgi:DNA-binding NtrC family response regulator
MSKRRPARQGAFVPDTSKQATVYIVDDDPVIASTLETILSKHGFHVTSFTLPLVALQTALASPPDLLISDVSMPELDGVELAIEVTERHSACRVLLISGHASTADLLHVARKRGHSFEMLAKPVHPAVVIDKIHQALSEQRA